MLAGFSPLVGFDDGYLIRLWVSEGVRAVLRNRAHIEPSGSQPPEYLIDGTRHVSKRSITPAYEVFMADHRPSELSRYPNGHCVAWGHASRDVMGSSKGARRPPKGTR